MRSCSRTPRGRRRSSSTRSRSPQPDVVVADAALAEVLDAAGAPATRICVDDDAPPGWLSFWDLVFGTPGQPPAPLPESRARRRLRVPVQLGHDGPAQGGAPHPPVAGRRGDQLELGVRGARRRSRAVLPAAVPHLRDRDHGLHLGVGRDHHVVPALRPRHDAVAHRADPGHVGVRGCAHRGGDGQPPRAREVRPLVASLHDVGGHPDRRGRRQPGHRTHGDPLAGRLRRHRGARACTATRSTTRTAARLDTPGLPVSDLEVRDRRPRDPRGRRARHRRRDHRPWSAHDGGLPAGRGRRRRVPRRLGAHRRRRAGSSPRGGSTSPTGPRR